MTAQFEHRPAGADKNHGGHIGNLIADRTKKLTSQISRVVFSVRYYFVRSFLGRAEFLLDQANKTIRRPSRILRIPYLYFARWLFWIRHISNIPLLSTRGSTSDESIRRQRADHFFLAGNRLLQKNQPIEAWQSYQHCLDVSKDWLHFFIAAVALFHGLGRYREAMVLFARANELRMSEARERGVADCPYRVLDHFWAGSFGHLAVLDYVVKLGILEGRSHDDTILFIPPHVSVANRCLLEQWRPHLRLIEQASDLPFPVDAVNALRFDYLGPRLDDGSTPFLWPLAAKTYRRWHAEKRPPLLTLAPDLEERGRRALRGKGIPDDAWFVGMHVREVGSKWHHDALHQILNADVMSYLPAIAEITKRGGWVIRMGDPSMVPLPPMANVLDYCHSDLRSDWMDVFITARCRFFLGTSSGPAYLPPLYGLPSVLTNWWPPAQRPWHPTDIFIPKLMRRKDSGELLTLSETVVEPFSYCHSLTYLQQVEKVYVEDNDAEDIRAAVVEMFDRLDGGAGYDAEDTASQSRAERIYSSHDAFGMAQLARDFVKRNKWFVE